MRNMGRPVWITHRGHISPLTPPVPRGRCVLRHMGQTRLDHPYRKYYISPLPLSAPRGRCGWTVCAHLDAAVPRPLNQLSLSLKVHPPGRCRRASRPGTSTTPPLGLSLCDRHSPTALCGRGWRRHGCCRCQPSTGQALPRRRKRRVRKRSGRGHRTWPAQSWCPLITRPARWGFPTPSSPHTTSHIHTRPTPFIITMIHNPHNPYNPYNPYNPNNPYSLRPITPIFPIYPISPTSPSQLPPHADPSPR